MPLLGGAGLSGRSPKWSPATLTLAVIVVLLASVAIFLSRSPLPAVTMANGLEVRCLNDSAWPTEEGGDPDFLLTVAGHEVPEVEVLSSSSLEYLTLDFERRAAASIELEGGQVAERILRPDGRVSFRVVPDSTDARRRVWPFPARYRYRLKWVMPNGPGGPLGVNFLGEPEES